MSNQTAADQPQQTSAQEIARKVHQKMLDDYEADCRAWEEERDSILRKRDAMLESELEKKRQMLQSSTEAEFRRKREALRRELDDCITRKSCEEARLAPLGFFAFGEKHSAKKAIRALTQQIAELEGRLKDNDLLYQEQQYRDQDALSEFRVSRQVEIQRQYPIPAKPVKPLRLLHASGPMTAQQRANMEIQQEILEFMEEGRPYTVADIIDGCPVCVDLTNQRVAALLRGLVPEYVERIESRRTAYFTRITKVPSKLVFAVRQEAFATSASPVQTTNSTVKQGILEFMVPGNLYSVSELIESCPVCAGLPNARVSAMLRQLREESRLGRVETTRRAYFYRIN